MFKKANRVDPDQTAPIGAVSSGSTLFASILNSSVLLGNYLQQTTTADDIFRCIFFLGALRVKTNEKSNETLRYRYVGKSVLALQDELLRSVFVRRLSVNFKRPLAKI